MWWCCSQFSVTVQSCGVTTMGGKGGGPLPQNILRRKECERSLSAFTHPIPQSQAGQVKKSVKKDCFQVCFIKLCSQPCRVYGWHTHTYTFMITYMCVYILVHILHVYVYVLSWLCIDILKCLYFAYTCSLVFHLLLFFTFMYIAVCFSRVYGYLFIRLYFIHQLVRVFCCLFCF